MGQSLSKMEYLWRQSSIERFRAETLFVVLCRTNLHGVVPDFFVGPVGIPGCDCADLVCHAFLKHGEIVDGLGEDRRLVDIQHFDVNLFIEIHTWRLGGFGL